MIQSTLKQNPIFNEVFNKQQAHSLIIKNSTIKERLSKLKSIIDYIKEPRNESLLIEALQKDLGKHKVESLTTEIGVVIGTYKHIRRNIYNWLADKKVKTPLSLMGATSYIKHESKGTCLIISPWNYPFQLSINPLLFNIAAGNTAIIKPSEFAPATASFISTMISDLFDKKEIVVYLGEKEVAQELLSLPFDHIYFTGSPYVGKIVMTAAAKNLSSVTLELGGKSPCIIDKAYNLKKAANRIAWGKFLNAGQTCIAPDYILIHKKIADDFVQQLVESIKNKLYKSDTLSSDYSKLINEKHFDRCTKLLNDAINKSAKLHMGDIQDRDKLIFAPTILTDVTMDMDIMKEELFCPILPIVTYETQKEALEIIRSIEKPLAFYIFSSNNKFISYFLENSSAGGTVINDCAIHYGNPNLPFGGVNNSGLGKAHIDLGEFINSRAVMHQHLGLIEIIHPPYSNLKEKIIRFIFNWLS